MQRNSPNPNWWLTCCHKFYNDEVVIWIYTEGTETEKCLNNFFKEQIRKNSFRTWTGLKGCCCQKGKQHLTQIQHLPHPSLCNLNSLSWQTTFLASLWRPYFDTTHAAIQQFVERLYSREIGNGVGCEKHSSSKRNITSAHTVVFNSAHKTPRKNLDSCVFRSKALHDASRDWVKTQLLKSNFKFQLYMEKRWPCFIWEAELNCLFCSNTLPFLGCDSSNY